MKLFEARVFKNGGSNAIRIPAAFKLEPGGIVYIELNEDSENFVVSRHKPTRMANFFAAQKRIGPISDADWNLERHQQPAKTRKSIEDLIDD